MSEKVATGNDGSDPRVLGRGLQRHGPAERHADHDDRPYRQKVESLPQVFLLVVAVRAGFAFRLAVGATVVGQGVEAALQEALGDVDADARLSAEPCR
jgi:hypothetical protein